MTYPIGAGIELSLNGVNWYKITDHNREPIESSQELIESSQRMANGKMRKYVIAQKNTISTNWSYVPSKTSECVDGNYGAAWLESFYNANARVPIYLRINVSEISTNPAIGAAPDDFYFQSAQQGSKTYQVFMTNFSKTIIHRTRVSDYVSMSIEFVEI